MMSSKILKKISRKFYRSFYLVRLFFYQRPFLKFGKRVSISFPICLEGKENISIGDDAALNAFVHIWGHGGVKIGNRVLIATHVAITSSTHDYSHEIMRFAPIISKHVLINDDVWIGSNSVIMPGVTIGKGAVIRADAVVTKNIPENAVAFGNPAKIIKYRDINIK